MRKKAIKSKPSPSKSLKKQITSGIGSEDRCNHDAKFAGINKIICWFCGKPLEWNNDKLIIKTTH